jgi:hypothetical protein
LARWRSSQYGSNEQIFGAKQQVPERDQSDKKGEIPATNLDR